MQNQTGNLSTTVPAQPSTSELCQEYTNAIFYGAGMPLYAVCTFGYEKEKDRVKTLFFFHLHCNSSGPLMFYVEIFRLYHIFEDNDTLDLGIAAEN